MRIIRQDMIDAWIEQSPRKRTIFRLHEHHEPVQRMVNTIRPHKHQDPEIGRAHV